VTTRILEIRQGILSKNDALAAELRARFAAARVLVVNLLSSPGSGKTALLERTLRELRAAGHGVAAVVGDLATDNDARRLAASGAPVRQITTEGRCHLEAAMISEHLEGWSLADLDFLFIENVGNLVCPASYDLGESLRVVLLSVTEGEDKPLKYPLMFRVCDVALLNKIDLLAYLDYDIKLTTEYIRRINPPMPIFETSSKTGAGLDAWLDWIRQKVAAKKG
jgi:hydrogenase nickel incorporation protein HypB